MKTIDDKKIFEIPDEWVLEIEHQRSERDTTISLGPDLEDAEQFALQRMMERKRESCPRSTNAV